ncbi:MAG: methionyl-tRNA formyltransferase [Clostridia bacterium]|nr:methionyl-tRNA formyltransferase [Clostridia bacterium]
MKILFMGSPDFAVVSLEALYKAGHEIAGVVSVPDKPMGRGKKMTAMPVKQAAERLGLPVFCPQTLRDGAFLETLKSLDPEMIIVVAYGKILPSYVLDYPKYGCINVHGSLLPEYRGAAPMQRAILDGKSKTGVTIMYMDVGLDTGDMLIKKELEIKEDDNFETVHDALAALGAEAITEAVSLAEQGRLVREKQDDSLATYAEKITKEECHIDFSLDARTLHNKIRGMSPFPLAYSLMPDGSILKIVKARISKTHNGAQAPGSVLSLDNGVITVSCGEGAVDIEGVLPQGKGRMRAADFINGRKIKVGDILS